MAPPGIVAAVGGGEVDPSWADLLETLTLQTSYNARWVIIGTTLLGVAAGVVGAFTMLRKRALVADALSHATLPGIALAFIVAALLGTGEKSLPVLLLGAAIAGVIGVGCIQLIIRCTRLREDASIGIVLSVFFGAGVVLLSVVQNMRTGNAAGVNSFIYGQTAAIRAPDAFLMGGIALAAVAAAVLLRKELACVCFNDAFARVDGWPVWLLDLVMMALVALVTVAGLQAVGLLLVVAMLIIPPVAARFWSERLGVVLVLGGVLGGASGYIGSVISSLFPNKPAGAVIVLTSGAMFGLSLLLAPRRGVIAAGLRRARMRVRVAAEHMLEAAYEASLAAPDERAELSMAQRDRLAELRGWPAWLAALLERLLRWRGLAVGGGRSELVLTERGRRAGARIHRNHLLWEQYLISYADVAPSHVDWSVDQVEHVLSERLVNELERSLEKRGVRIAANHDAPRPTAGAGP